MFQTFEKNKKYDQLDAGESENSDDDADNIEKALLGTETGGQGYTNMIDRWMEKFNK